MSTFTYLPSQKTLFSSTHSKPEPPTFLILNQQVTNNIRAFFIPMGTNFKCSIVIPITNLAGFGVIYMRR